MAEQAKKILVVGGITGGIAIAMRLRRLDESLEITVIDRSWEIALAPYAIPHCIGEEPASFRELRILEPGNLWKQHRIEYLPALDAIRIDRDGKCLVVRDRKKKSKIALPYDKLVLSTGARPIRPQVPGIDSPLVHTVQTLRDAEGIQEILRHNTGSSLPVVILGASSLGISMAEALCRRNFPVVLMEAAGRILVGADPEMVLPMQQAVREKGIELRCGISLSEIVQDSKNEIRLRLSDDEERTARFVIVAAGVRPEVSLALDAGLELGLTGGIKVNDRMQTRDPDIYAIGDAVEVPIRRGEKTLVSRIPLLRQAQRQAKIAADHLHGFRHHPYISFGGTSVCRFFDRTYASTGSTEKQLLRERIPFDKVYIHSERSDYLDDPLDLESLSLKILFSPSDGTLLGAQAVGDGDVVRRIDVLATALRFGGTVRQLGDLELCYVPPHGTPRDPLQVAGNIATDVLDGLLRHANRKELKYPRPGQIVLDVRTPEEFREGTLSHAVSLPLEELRDRIGELDKDKEYLLLSQYGIRGYLACRILLQQEFHAKNFSGGYRSYRELSKSAVNLKFH